MIAKGMSAIRYFSLMNQWIDFVVIVPEEFHDAAMEVTKNAINMYWNFMYECYGDAVENELAAADIPFEIRYIPWNDDLDVAVDEDAWEAWIGDLFKECRVTNLN